MVIYLISAISFFLSYKLFKKAAGTLSVQYFNSVTYVFWYCIIISTFVGSIFCAFDYGQDHWILSHAKHDARIYAWLAVCYSMITMPIGMIMVNKICGLYKPRTALINYINKPINLSFNNRQLKYILIFSIILSILTFIYIKINSGSWPFYTAVFEHNYSEAREGRIDVRRNFHGIEYIKNLIGLLMVPLLSYFSYIIYIIKKTFFFKICFVILLCVTVLTLLYDTQKAPIIFYAAGFLVIRVMIKGPIKKKWIGIFIVAALLLMALLYTAFNEYNHGLLDILLDPKSAMWGRLFISGYAGVPLSFEWFPDYITQPTWQIGISEFILEAFGLPTTESARLMMLKLNPSGNLISSYFIAEAWANYGFIGVMLAPFIVGFNVQILQVFLLKSNKDPLILAFYAIMTTRWVISSGFSNYLFFKALLIGFIVYYITRFFVYSHKFKIKI